MATTLKSKPNFLTKITTYNYMTNLKWELKLDKSKTLTKDHNTSKFTNNNNL